MGTTATNTSQNQWVTTPGVDFLQLIQEGGGAVSWIDSNGVPQGAMAAPALSKVTLSSAQLKALPGTKPVLIPAPGAGKVTIVESYAMRYIFGTTPYTIGNADNNIQLEYDSNSLVFQATFAAGFLDQSVNMVAYYTWTQSAQPSGPTPVPETDIANRSIVLTLTGTTPGLTLGNGSLEIQINTLTFTL